MSESDEEVFDDSLSKVLNYEPGYLAIFLPCLCFGVAGWIVFSPLLTDPIQGFLLLGLSLVGALASFYVASAVRYLYKQWHLLFGGRLKRDARFIDTQARNSGCSLEPLPHQGNALFFRMHLEHESRYSLFVDAGGDASVRVSDICDSQYPQCFLLFEPRIGGYCVRLQVVLSEAQRHPLLPCVASREVKLGDWLEVKPVQGDRELLARPFLWGPKPAPMSLCDGSMRESIPSYDRLSAQARRLLPWFFAKGYWTSNGDLTLQAKATLEQVKSLISELTWLCSDLKEALQQVQKPIVRQLLDEVQMGSIVWHRGVFRTRFVKHGYPFRTRYIRRWWSFLLAHSEPYILQAAVGQLLLDGSPSIREIFGGVSAEVRDARLPLIQRFVEGGWRQALQQQEEIVAQLRPDLDIPRGDTPKFSSPMRISFPDPYEIMATDLLLLLQRHLPKGEFLKTLNTIFQNTLHKASSNEEQTLAVAFQLAMLDTWEERESADVGRLLYWLEHGKEARFRSRLLEKLEYLLPMELDVETLLMDCLILEEELTPEQRDVCLRAIGLLGERGSYQCIPLLELGLASWDTFKERAVRRAAKAALRILRAEESPMEGALSPAIDVEQQGQLSLHEQSHKQGQLSLTKRSNAQPTGPRAPQKGS